MIDDAGGAGGLAGGLPDFEVRGGGLGEGWVEFYADGFFEGELGGQHDGSAFAAAYVDEGVFAERALGWGSKPEIEHGAEAGWGDGVVGGGEDVVRVVRGEMDCADESAGIDSVLGVEGMGDGGESGAFGFGEAVGGQAKGLLEAAMDQRPAEFAKG